MGPPSELGTLGEILRAARDSRKQTQDQVGKLVDKGRQWTHGVERGDILPSLRDVLALHEKLEIELPPSVLMAKWLEQTVIRELDKPGFPPSHGKLARGALADILSSTAAATGPLGPLSLEQFPLHFQPLSIILGDRREPSVKTVGDVLAYSFSVTDVMFLLDLKLDARSTLIRSDKLLANMDDDWLQRKFGETNLLIVGSPAVNLAARWINPHAIFRFDIDPEIQTQASRLQKTFHDLEAPTTLASFWQMLLEAREGIEVEKYYHHFSEARARELAEVAKQSTFEFGPKDIMNKFAKPGLLDPADKKRQGERIRESSDFGVISLAPNPFAEDPKFVAIMVAGINGPGTAQALRMLGRPAAFRDHPYGGVIEVTLQSMSDWPTRFEQASAVWETKPYSREQLKGNLVEIAEARNRDGMAEFENFSVADLKSCIDFVTAISKADAAGVPATSGG